MIVFDFGYTQNRLIFRKMKWTQNLPILVGIVVYFLTEHAIIYERLFIYSSLTLITSLYLIQDAYRRGKSSLDIHHFYFFPQKKTALFNRYLLIDITEWKSVFIIIHLILIATFSNFSIAVFTLLILLNSSLCFSLHNFLVRRYNWAYQALLRGIGAIITIPFFPMMWISFENENKSWMLEKLSLLDHHIQTNIIMYNISLLVLLIGFYFLVKNIIISKIKIDLYPNQKLINRHGSIFI